MAEYPLIFGYADVVSGKGYLAGVRVEGRSLLVQEEDGWWMLGAQPGALAASGDTASEAAAAFRNTYRTVLFDIAAEAPSFEVFKTDVEAFVAQTDEDLDRWQAALMALRNGESHAEEGGAFVAELPRKRADADARVWVARLDVERQAELTPAINRVDRVGLAEAA